MSEMEENLEKMKRFRFTQRPNFIISPCGMCHLPIPVGEEGCFVGVGSSPSSVMAVHMRCAEEAMQAGKCDYMIHGDGCFCDHGIGDDGEPCRQCDGMRAINNHPGAEYIWKKAYQVGAVKPPPIYMIVNTEGKMEEWTDGDSWTRLGVHLSRKGAEEIERGMKAAAPDDKDDPTKYRMVKYVPEESKVMNESSSTPNKIEAKRAFVLRLAEYLVRGQACRSIELEMGMPEAKMWAMIRGTTPLVGYPTVEEAVKLLTEFLG